MSEYKEALNTGGAVKSENISVLPGGTGNVAVTISRLGGSAAFCGVVGDDALGRAYVRDLKDNCIFPAVHRKVKSPTGILLALLSQNAERSFIVSRGANNYLELEYVRSAFERFRPNVLFISGYSLTKKSTESVLFDSIDLARKCNSKIVFDCTPYNLVQSKREVFMNIISKSFCTCLNYHEARSLFDVESSKGLIALLKKSNCFFALKLGSRGCILISPRGTTRITAKKVVAKDTNGAGDCFAGAIAYGISRNLTELEMGRLGVRLGTLKVKFNGPRLPKNLKISARD
jgi:sugar/nucleoside kinase (ribokinase family)